ncbi:probable serine/threonine-protein kinase pats1 isoform X2 [Sycon ciliatum]|uniref:probable serine/threonine-protein kinase pats1 isoform X2 n=1 Tax=Sycon ciliatum TaxID=27933 RepID=UPI0031F6D14B
MTTAEESLLQDLGLRRGQIAYLGAIAVRDEDEIGRGSDAVVYRVEWQGIPVAAKVPHSLLVQPGVHGREEKLRGFGAEISNLSRLHHPNLCQTLGIGSTADRGLPALVVELFDRTLHECSIGEGRLDDLTLMSFLEHAIAGVRYLHSSDPPVIHRDLTLRNVLIKGNVAKLADFGVARVTQRHLVGLLPDLTTCPGTHLYMPPEALSELAVYNESLDIFSYAVLATSVLTGSDPSRNLLSSPRTRVVERVDGVNEERVISEVERRQLDLARIPDDHPLKPAIIRGLSNSAEGRPIAEEMHEFVKVAQRDLAMNVQEDRAEQRLEALEGRVQERTRDAELAGTAALDQNQLLGRLTAMERQLERVTMIADRTVSIDERLSTAVASLTHTAEQVVAVREQMDAVDESLSAVKQDVANVDRRTASTEERIATIAEQSTATQAQCIVMNERINQVQDGLETIGTRATATQQDGAMARQPSHLTTKINKEFLARIAKARKWVKVDVAADGIPALLVAHGNRLVCVWISHPHITSIQQTTDLVSWTSIGLPLEFHRCHSPSLASNGKRLFMYCIDDEGKPVFLQYGPGWLGSRHTWSKLSDVPDGIDHSFCAMHATENTVSLFGSMSLCGSQAISTYSLAGGQWNTPASRRESGHQFPSLPYVPGPPGFRGRGSVVECDNTLFLIGGEYSRCLRLRDGRWEQDWWPEIDLTFGTACALSADSIAMFKFHNGWSCTVRHLPSSKEYNLIVPSWSIMTALFSSNSHSEPSMAVFQEALVLSLGSQGVFTLDMRAFQH